MTRQHHPERRLRLHRSAGRYRCHGRIVWRRLRTGRAARVGVVVVRWRLGQLQDSNVLHREAYHLGLVLALGLVAVLRSLTVAGRSLALGAREVSQNALQATAEHAASELKHIVAAQRAYCRTKSSSCVIEDGGFALNHHHQHSAQHGAQMKMTHRSTSRAEVEVQRGGVTLEAAPAPARVAIVAESWLAGAALAVATQPVGASAAGSVTLFLQTPHKQAVHNEQRRSVYTQRNRTSDLPSCFGEAGLGGAEGALGNEV